MIPIEFLQNNLTVIRNRIKDSIKELVLALLLLRHRNLIRTAFLFLADIRGGNTMNAAYIQDSLSANFGSFGALFITVSLALFAFTTLIGNYYYAEMNINYLVKDATENKTFIFCYRLLAVVIIFIGAQLKAGLAWDLADVLMGFMALINVPVCLILGGTAFKALEDYVAQRKEGKDPVFKASSIGVKDTDYWN